MCSCRAASLPTAFYPMFLADPPTDGSRHDKRLAEEDAPPFPPGSYVPADSGYQGLTFEGVNVVTPMKKPRCGDLTPTEKELNTALAKKRIYIENGIGGMKVSRILRDPFRNHAPGMSDIVIEVAAGLYNYKCQLRDDVSVG